MFAEHTRESILAIACVDSGVTENERDKLTKLLSGRRGDELLSYKTAASRLRLSLSSVKRLAAAGKLKRVIGTGSRACGVTATSVEEFGE